MKTAIKILTLLATLIVMSFTNTTKDVFIGTYGVCESDPSQIKLILNSDQTFYYQDFSLASKKISIKGKWSRKGKKVVLENSASDNKFHNVWTFEENGQVAKSRKGLCFYRLTKIN